MINYVDFSIKGIEKSTMRAIRVLAATAEVSMNSYIKGIIEKAPGVKEQKDRGKGQ